MGHGLADRHASILAQLDAGSDQSINAFVSLSIPMSPATQLRVAMRWARDLASPMGTLATPVTGARGATRLRVGYVSSDFRTHAMASLLAEVWERHDRTRLETYAYSIGPRETSPLRARIEAAFGHFADCSDTARQWPSAFAPTGCTFLSISTATTREKRLFALRPPVQHRGSATGHAGSAVVRPRHHGPR